MSCPVCDGTMQSIVEKVYWCPRCGCLRDERQCLIDRKTLLASRVLELKSEMQRLHIFLDSDRDLWHRLGISEAISRPKERT